MSGYRKVLIIAVFLFSIFSHICPLWALEKDTHDYLNRNIARNYSILPAYLKNQIGFEKAIDEVIGGRTVEEWIGIGGIKEDEPAYIRSLNHFHDPLQPWNLAGFKMTFKSSV